MIPYAWTLILLVSINSGTAMVQVPMYSESLCKTAGATAIVAFDATFRTAQYVCVKNVER